MARPVPNALFLTDLARWVQSRFRKEMDGPTLLAAEPWANMALVAGFDEKAIHVLDRKRGQIVRDLLLPPRIRKGVDYGHFIYSADGLCVAAYNDQDHTFAAWSLNDGELIHYSEGVGGIKPAMCFMPGGRLAVCDGPRLHTWQTSGNILYTTPISDDLRSLVLYSPPTTKPTVIAVSVFRKGIGGHHLHSFRIEEGVITGRQEGPYRPRSENQSDMKTISVHELVNIPGSTERVLVVCEEEKIEKKADSYTEEWEYDDEFKTRFLAVDPRRGMFYPTEVELKGRHCLEIQNSDLLVIDELGRKRRIAGFPLKLENFDWRLNE